MRPSHRIDGNRFLTDESMRREPEKAVFGSNGACGGCLCMSWRTQRGERWADIKGVEAKRRMRSRLSAPALSAPVLSALTLVRLLGPAYCCWI